MSKITARRSRQCCRADALGIPTTLADGLRKPNLDIVHTICDLLDEMSPRGAGRAANLITFVKDRPGHDRRYAMDAHKIERELGWRPKETLRLAFVKRFAGIWSTKIG